MRLYYNYRGAHIISLFRWKHLKLELCFFPAGYRIDEHTHNNEWLETVFLFGNAVFHKRKLVDGKPVVLNQPVSTKDNFLQVFTTRPDESHWSIVYKLTVTLNIERWLTDDVTSACKDIQYTDVNEKFDLTS